MGILQKLLVTGFSLCAWASAPVAQTAADTIVVFDGSGSMWGQIDQLTKIEIARDTLSSVLGELDEAQNIGMIAYGHRQKGVCSDIEDIVPLGPARQTVPAIINAANAINPRGKTPITDAVRRAAEALKYTENAATVVLLTDGIETCDADPCALAAELERLGVGFTTHVVGFGLSEDEGRQVQCLADTTGGLYFSAQTAEELGNALRQTVQTEVAVPSLVPSDEDFVDALPSRQRVIFRFRDTPDGDQIGARQLTGTLERANGTAVEDGAFEFAFPEANGASATADLEPGSYTGRFRRDGGASGGYDVVYTFDVPQVEGDHVIDASFAGMLNINLFINPKMPFTAGDPFPRATRGSSPRIYLQVFRVENGQVSQAPVAEGRAGQQSFPLAAGQYLVRGNLDRTTAAEQSIEVVAGQDTEMNFSFDATRVYVDARDASGAPVERQTTYWYDKIPSGRNYWVSGGGVSDGVVVPFYLPTGDWVVNVGDEGAGKRRSERVVSVPGDYAELRIDIGEGLTLDEDDTAYLSSPAYTGCAEMLKVVRTGCLVRPEKHASATTPVTAPEQTQPAAQAASDAPREPSEEVATLKADDVTPAAQNGEGFEGLSGEVITFLADRGDRRFHIVYQPDALENATLILEDGWCGVATCNAKRLIVPYDQIAQMRLEGELTWTTFHEGYLFQLRKFGGTRSVSISGDGGRDVAFTFEKTVTLGQSAANAPDEDQVRAPAGRSEPLAGVFGLHSEAPLDTLLSGVTPLVVCQSDPVVFFPDGRIEQKTFDTTDPNQPYATLAAAQCGFESGLHRCEAEAPSQTPIPFGAFTITDVQDVHFKLCDETGRSCLIAVSCFHEGSDLLAATPMPGGQILSQMLLMREDGQSAGFRYDTTNALVIE
ncbi:MAG: VWA domain-containing protein [Roseovarius sp.]